MYLCLREDHSSNPAERDNQEKESVFELHTRGKALGLFVLLEVLMSPNVLRHVGGELHSLCGFQNQATVSLSQTLNRTCAKLCTTVKKQILCTSLSPCGRQGVDCHSYDPTFLVHVRMARKRQSCSVSVKGTTRLTLFRKTDSFPPRPPVCLPLCLCLSCCSCPCWCCCCCCYLICLMLLHLVSSSLSPDVPFCHSSGTC